MKKMITIVASVALAGSVSFAAGQKKDNKAAEGKEAHKVETSTNPVTGTKTTTEEFESKADGKHGKHDVKGEHKTKVKKDGEVTKETEIEAESTNK